MRLLVFAVVLLVSALTVALGVKVYRYSREQTAIDELRQAGGFCTRDDAGPDWLRRWIGPERMKYLSYVDGVVLEGAGVTDRDLGHLASFRGLRYLSISETGITDAGKAIAGLTALDSLH